MPVVGSDAFTATDHAMMAEALRLAERGLWTTDPNPRVGCVIAHGDEVVGRGWHERAGGPHAEVAALAEAGERAAGACAYVTLEPCSHHGRTPPCADALIEAGPARVICAMRDPHPHVDGNGIERLGRAGIEVAVGLMEPAARALNPGFVSRIERGRPWVRAKLAGSLDGRSIGPDGKSQWITGEAARRDGRRWRARAGAVLTGIETVLADDPGLDPRIDDAARKPLVVVADSRGRLPPTARLLGTGAGCLHAVAAGAPASPASCERLEIEAGRGGRLRLDRLLAMLAEREINELHVEAGATLTGALLAAGLVDELLVYQAATLIGADGGAMVRLPGIDTLDRRLRLCEIERRRVGDDWRIRFRPADESTIT
ncbi:MAG: bifunctional diaminohydroxyphosphoribosylaminopyrimidine deaminase/5-amino-6-(5-phosphoribosylamino)uracil reductase RibD [Wenzhouxiangellaceae bacterium]|nr:bifunctional diaminohydroxyphosphoribosylaminopyrimidine deaminase/5-amino-6-(5-phosphoribosylamino)uracil reductase RibD [Wenzhouxiangellaceae bacterium]